MATKINPDFYGAENTFVTITTDIAKKSAYTLADLFSNDIYTGGGFDTTASPWGIGKSSISSDYQAQATKGATWTIYSHVNERKNTPIWFYSNLFTITGGDRPEEITGSTSTNWHYARMLYKNRTSPNVELSGNELLSKNMIDENDEISVPNTNTITPVTFLDYSKTRVCLGNVYYKINGNPYFGSTSFSNFAAGGVTTDAIFGFDFSIRDIYGNILNVYASIGGGELPIPDYYKTCYYGDNVTSWVRPWRRIQSVGYWSIPNLAWREFNSATGCLDTSAMEMPTNDDCAISSPASNGWGHTSDTLQTFDDVSYHWEMGFTPKLSTDWWNISKLQTGDTYVSGLFRSYAYMAIDDETADYVSLTKAILHEIAFLGLPFCFSTAKATSAIGSDDIYLPVFDEHLITTGEYVNGAESLNLPNALWNDIFGAEMPEYDPEYEPDEPIPAGDYGDTTNIGNLRVRIPSDLKVYLMDESTLHQMLYRLNNYYSDKTPDDWTIDFQGVNPSDYILGCYVTRLNLPPSSVGEAVKIGVIDLNLSAYTLSQLYDYWCTIDFGTRTIEPRYNDFRDYAPYTSVELYLPLAGTVDLDVNYCMGHNITVKYYYDVLTMSCVAAVYRDNMLYKCSDCKIGAEIPLLSSNMGSYQNQIEQLSVARQRNNIAIATSGAAAIAGTTAAIATGSPMAIIGAAGGFSKLADNIIESSNLDYQFDHIAPSVSVTGAADAQNNLCVGQLMPKLIIKRPVMLSGHNDTIYSKTVGNACCINDYIGSRIGLVVCSNINANDIVNAYGESPTADEINSIKQAFSTGVYV